MQDNINDINLLFAKRLKMIRKERGFTQDSLARAAGVNITYISMLERCQRNITIAKADQIAKALKVRLIELLE